MKKFTLQKKIARLVVLQRIELTSPILKKIRKSRIPLMINLLRTIISNKKLKIKV